MQAGVPDTRSLRGGLVIEAEERAAAGPATPEAVTVKTAGYETADVLWTKVAI
jgi:hypothetical protein